MTTDLQVTASPDPLALTGALVYADGRFDPATVVVDAGRVVAAGRDAGSPGGARQLDCGGLVVLPGFVDCHVHVQFSTAAAILGGGVTTVRDLGGPPSAGLELAGRSPLRVLAAGRILTPVGGYPSRSWGTDGTARQVRDADDAAAAVAEQVDAGAAVVKVALEPAAGPVFGADVLRRIVDAAHAGHRCVTAHVGGARELALALDAGVDELAHLPLYDVSPAEMVSAAEAGVVLVATLAIRGPDRDAQHAVQAFREAGGRVVYGTDLGNGGIVPGIETAEVRALVGAGMTLTDVLDAATAAAADHLGLPDVGRIAPGQAADLIAVPASLVGGDVDALRDVRLVLSSGTPIVDRLRG